MVKQGIQQGLEANSAVGRCGFSTARRRRGRKKVGIIELVAYTVSSEWLSLPLVRRFKRQFYSVMPQVVSVWCRELGHDVTYTTYYGQGDPITLLPNDLDVVFIAASSQASALAYALAKVYRRRGTFTVAGGPHAKCFPVDCARFFDVTVVQCDRDLIADIVAGRIGSPKIVTTSRPLRSFPTVAERLPEITKAAFSKGSPDATTVIALYGSVGCPYSCNFCTDWNSNYAPLPPEQLRCDLDFVSRQFPKSWLGFQDPNFGVRFDETMQAFESVPKRRRNPYIMQCSLAILSEKRMQSLAETRCLYFAPGIESWSSYGDKLKMKTTTGHDRVVETTHKFEVLRRHVRGLQANFVQGLDIDYGSMPFELTKEFVRKAPFVWPNINVITPYGGTPVFEEVLRERRLLHRMPLALYCSPYLAMTLQNYEPIEFYDLLIDLLETSISAKLTGNRLVSREHTALKVARLAQTTAVRRDLTEMRRIRSELRHNAQLRAFHEGRNLALPALYRHHLYRRLGRYAELLTDEDKIPLHAPSPQVAPGETQKADHK